MNWKKVNRQVHYWGSVIIILPVIIVIGSGLLPAQMVQGFGQSLLSALEKKDAEELRLLQLTHERNIQSLTRSVKQRQIKEAGEQLTAA
ncbi:MAG: hypothetical protein ACI9UN_002551 [Granulosicoccus sp.]|jgi:hypothetical protein